MSLTHVIRYRADDSATTSWLDAHKVGETLAAVVDQLQLFGRGLTLEAVLALDLAAGTITDVTATALWALSGQIEAENDELPGGLIDAFERHRVALPAVPTHEPWDADDEHRLSASQLGLVGRAA